MCQYVGICFLCLFFVFFSLLSLNHILPSHVHCTCHLFNLFFNLLCMGISVCRCTMCAAPKQARTECYISWNWSYSCELPCGCWELNLHPLEEQQHSGMLSCLSRPSCHLPSFYCQRFSPYVQFTREEERRIFFSVGYVELGICV